MRDFIERLKAKPKAVRERVVIGTSLGVTGVIALGWLAVMVVTSPFGPKTTDPEISQSLSNTKTDFSNLLGAARASLSASSTPSDGIIITDSTPEEPAGPTTTVLPF